MVFTQDYRTFVQNLQLRERVGSMGRRLERINKKIIIEIL